jgi:hypothetical protein
MIWNGKLIEFLCEASKCATHFWAAHGTAVACHDQFWL